MKRTFILSVLVLACVAYIIARRHSGTRDALASAKDKIAHAAQQPTAHSSPARAPAPTAQPGAAEARDTEGPPAESAAGLAAPSTPDGPGPGRVVRLTKGTFTVVDGEIVYGPDAELDIGHGMLVSSPSGVMVSDVDQRHIAGDLVIDSQYGTTTSQNAFVSIDDAHVEITSDNTVTVKKDAPK